MNIIFSDFSVKQLKDNKNSKQKKLVLENDTWRLFKTFEQINEFLAV